MISELREFVILNPEDHKFDEIVARFEKDAPLHLDVCDKKTKQERSFRMKIVTLIRDNAAITVYGMILGDGGEAEFDINSNGEICSDLRYETLVDQNTEGETDD